MELFMQPAGFANENATQRTEDTVKMINAMPVMRVLICAATSVAAAIPVRVAAH